MEYCSQCPHCQAKEEAKWEKWEAQKRKKEEEENKKREAERLRRRHHGAVHDNDFHAYSCEEVAKITDITFLREMYQAINPIGNQFIYCNCDGTKTVRGLQFDACSDRLEELEAAANDPNCNLFYEMMD